MVEGNELNVLREILRQGERQLADQKDTRESILRRAAELVRLAIAILGGLIIVSGILVTMEVRVTTLSIAGLGAGVALVVVAVGILSAILAGIGKTGLVAYGPNLRDIVDHWAEVLTTESDLLGSLAAALPGWADENEMTMSHMRRATGIALLLMATGTLILLVTLVYIQGVTIHA